MSTSVAPPDAVIAEIDKPKIFSLSQRLGRLRYLVYSLVFALACTAFLVLIYLIAWLLPAALGNLVYQIAFIVVLNLVIPVALLMTTMRRLHDINFRGWWALLALIPVVRVFTLVLLFIPGTKGNNRFGPPLASNHAGLRFAAIALPLALLGFFFSPFMRKDETNPNAATYPTAPSPVVPGLSPIPPGQKLKQY